MRITKIMTVIPVWDSAQPPSGFRPDVLMKDNEKMPIMTVTVNSDIGPSKLM